MSHIMYPLSHSSWPLEGLKAHPESSVGRIQCRDSTIAHNNDDDQPLDFSKKAVSSVHLSVRNEEKPVSISSALDYRKHNSPPISPIAFARPCAMVPGNTTLNELPSSLYHYNKTISRLNGEISSDSHTIPTSSIASADRVQVPLPVAFQCPLPNTSPNSNHVAFSPPHEAALGTINSTVLNRNKELLAYYNSALLNGDGLLRTALQPGDIELERKNPKQARPFKSYNPLPTNLPIVPLNVLSEYEDQEYRFQQFTDHYNRLQKDAERKKIKPSLVSTPSEVRTFASSKMTTPHSSPTSGQVDSSQRPFTDDNSSETSEGQPNSSCQAPDTSTSQSQNRHGKPSARSLPDELKDAAYWERRKKNNEAAKRSRDSRRQKEDSIAMRAKFLEAENQRLWSLIGTLKQQLRTVQCCADHCSRM